MNGPEVVLDRLDDNEDGLVRMTDIVGRCVMASILHPISIANTLIQLGYEPFPSSPARKYFIFGGIIQYNVNIYKYIIKLAWRDGISVLAVGMDSMICTVIVHAYSYAYISDYLDNHLPSVGGALELERVPDVLLYDDDAFRVMLRRSIRIAVVKVVICIVERPFYVIFVRQIAQIVGKEMKYTTVFESIYQAAKTEGLPSLYSGLPAEIICQCVKTFAIAGFAYIVERGIIVPQRERGHDSSVFRSILKNTVTLISSYLYQPFAVCSCLMAVSGTGLAACPVSNGFASWLDAYDYMNAVGGSRRGMRWVWRRADQKP